MSENEMPAEGLEKVLQYMTSVPAWYLATSVDGQPHVRPFSFAQIQDGKLWFVTATTKDVWQELLQNQLFEATSWWPGHGWLILRGKAGLVDEASPEMREAGCNTSKALASTTTDQTMKRSYSSAPMSPKHGFATTKGGCLWNCKLPHPRTARLRRKRQCLEPARHSV